MYQVLWVVPDKVAQMSGLMMCVGGWGVGVAVCVGGWGGGSCVWGGVGAE